MLQALEACGADVKSVMAESVDESIILASGTAIKRDQSGEKLLWKVQAAGQDSSMTSLLKDNSTGKISQISYEGDKFGANEELVSLDIARSAIRLSQIIKRSIANGGKVVENVRLIPSKDKSVTSWITLGASA